MEHKLLGRFVCMLLTLSLVLSMIVVPAAAAATSAESDDSYDGSQLWLNYRQVSDAARLAEYRTAATAIIVENFDKNPTYRHSRNGEVYTPNQQAGAKESIPATTLEAARQELSRALNGLLGQEVPYAEAVTDGAIVVGTPESSPIIAGLNLGDALKAVGDEGYLIRSATSGGKSITAVAANTDIGALYGTYALIRQMQTLKPMTELNIADLPKVNHRRLNNWDTERLYAGTNATGEGTASDGDGSIFNFTGSNALPLVLDRYIVFARVCASVGINEITINNVNAKEAYLSEQYILNEAVLADLLRPYGVRIGLSVRYTSATNDSCNTAADTAAGGPRKISGSDANNPYSDNFQNWWTQKTEQIRSRIPDFIGYTVKANSEGQPGPQDYGMTHGDGAKGMGQALEAVDDGLENNMTLFWRTFVYNASVDTDRLKRAYAEFEPIDGTFGENVFVQTKNGPLDFQGREPVHPMFGAMDQTNQAIELQITQEYTGHHISLCYLGTEWEEIFKTDTYAEGEGTLLGEIVDGTAQGQADTAIVGVNNVGNSANMTGNHFSQANFFAFGRQAWDWTQDSEEIAEDWVRMTWSNDEQVVQTIVQMMMGSYEALVSYQTPLGVGHQMTGTGTHYFPNPAQIIYNGGSIRDDWSPAYYSRVDGVGIGYNRTNHTEQTSFGMQQGSDLAGQYADGLAALYNNIETTPENLLLWFHHVAWDYEMPSGRTFWEEIVYRTQMGVQYVSWMREAWAGLEGKIDQRRFDEVTEKLWRQEIDASEWRDFYTGYWQNSNGLDKPVDDGPLSISITLGEGAGAKVYQGFDLAIDSFNKKAPGNLPSSDPRYRRYNAAGGSIADASGAPFSNMFVPVDTEYSIAVPAGVSHQISAVNFLSDEGSNEKYEIVSNTDEQAVVKVTRECFFGPLVKTYTFNFTDDANLSGISVNKRAISGFDPDTTEYAVMTDADVSAVPQITATADDPAAKVDIQQADAIGGKATVTVTNGSAEKTYTVSIAAGAAFDEGFDGSAPSQDWSWVRESSNRWAMADSALTITTESGEIKNAGDNGKNILVRSAGNGDWEAIAKLQLSAIPSAATQQAALLVYQDDKNYLKVDVEYCSSGSGWWAESYLRASAGRERNNTYSDLFYDALEIHQNITAAKNTVYFKIVKDGSSYRLYWSTDGGAEYKNLGVCTAELTDPKIGAYAVGGSSNAALRVSYDQITLTDRYDLLVSGNCTHENTEIRDAKEPTCTDPGYTGDTWCTDCGEKIEEGKEIPTTPHQYTDKIDEEYLVTAGTCVKPAVYHKSCSVCGHESEDQTFEGAVDKNNHTGLQKREQQEPTCTDPGYTGDTWCTDCGEKIEEGKEIPAKGHDWNDPVFTWNEEGTDATASRTCKNDSSHIESLTVAMMEEVTKEPTETEAGSKTYTATVTADGKTFTDTRVVEIPAGGHNCSSEQFPDLNPAMWYHSYTDYMIEHNYMNGVQSGSQTLFQPNASLTRGQLVTILYRIENSPNADGTTPFTDLTRDYYRAAVSWAYANEIVNGTSTTTFSPEKPVTREQLATILYRYSKDSAAAEDQLSTFPDRNQVSTYAEEGMNWAVANGIIDGNKIDNQKYLQPKGSATRVQICKMLYCYLEQVQ